MAAKTRYGPVQNDQCEKSCEIKGGSQEMAVMVWVDGKNFNNNSGKFVLPYLSFTRSQHKFT